MSLGAALRLLYLPKFGLIAGREYTSLLHGL